MRRNDSSSGSSGSFINVRLPSLSVTHENPAHTGRPAVAAAASSTLARSTCDSISTMRKSTPASASVRACEASAQSSSAGATLPSGPR